MSKKGKTGITRRERKRIVAAMAEIAAGGNPRTVPREVQEAVEALQKELRLSREALDRTAI